MSKPRLLLVASFTELEWGIRDALEEWAEVAAFDMPGVGDEPVPGGLETPQADPADILGLWREAGARRGLAEIDRRGWDRCVIVADSFGSPTAVRLARERSGAVQGLAIGHASLSHDTVGERAPVRREVWEAMGQLASTGSDAFVRYGIAQMTRGGTSEALAKQIVARFPDMDLVSMMVRALGEQPEPIGEELAQLDLPLLLAKHEGCLGRTDEGFEDIAAAFPDAQTVICPEQCSSSPALAEALRSFCLRVADRPPGPGLAARSAE
jgi:pimeloyl-ACP methyl ester carboxylesterase